MASYAYGVPLAARARPAKHHLPLPPVVGRAPFLRDAGALWDGIVPGPSGQKGKVRRGGQTLVIAFRR